MGEQGVKLRWAPPSQWQAPYSRTDGHFNPFPQPASAWKQDDREFVLDRRQHKMMGGRFHEPLLISPRIMDAANAVLDARARRS